MGKEDFNNSSENSYISKVTSSHPENGLIEDREEGTKTEEDRMENGTERDLDSNTVELEDGFSRTSGSTCEYVPSNIQIHLNAPCFTQNKVPRKRQTATNMNGYGDHSEKSSGIYPGVGEDCAAVLHANSIDSVGSGLAPGCTGFSQTKPEDGRDAVHAIIETRPSLQNDPQYHSHQEEGVLSAFPETLHDSMAESCVSKMHVDKESDSISKATRLFPEKDSTHVSLDLISAQPSTFQFVITPNFYSDSDTDEYSDFERKPDVRQGVTVTKNNAASKTIVPQTSDEPGGENDIGHGLWDVDSKAGIALVKDSCRTTRSRRKSTRNRTSIKQESKSTSDYEPPSEGRHGERLVGRVLPTRSKRKAAAASYIECSDASDDDTVAIPSRAKKKSQPVGRKASKSTRKQTANTRPGKQAAIKAVVSKADNRTCPQCHKTFTRAESLTIHMRVHTGERPFQCPHCHATYKVSSHLRNHVRSKHSNTKEFQCATCSKAFATSNARGRHEKTCGKDLSERVKFHCPRCSKGFVTVEGFERHKNMDSCMADEPLSTVPVNKQEQSKKEDAGDGDGAKSEEKPYKCPKCGKAFAEFTGLDCHQQFLCGKARGAVPHVCPQCSKPFTKWNRYVAHSRRHTGDRPFPCKYCNSRFFDRESLRKHVARHEGKNQMKCSLCDRVFSAKARLSMHIMRFHCGMKPYKCNECDSDFASAKLLSSHIRRVHRKEKRFKCQLCDKAFFEAQAWMKHMVLHASGKDPSVRGPVQQYPCNLCGQVMNMRLMRLHVEAHHPSVPLSEAVTKAMVTCKLCHKEFSDSSSLKIHMIRHTGKKDFKCDQCEMAFVTVHALQIHQRKHTDTRPYSCEDCGETFRWRASLRDHKINHHNPNLETADGDGRKFTCKECGQRFKRFNSLKSHTIRHRSVMPCICSECGKGFTDTTRLKIHMSCHSGSDRPFICETCGAGFFYTFLLRRHIQSRHSPSPWLCNLCGRSLCSKDALKRHLQHHANSPDGKVRVGGNRGRTKRKVKDSTQPAATIAMGKEAEGAQGERRDRQLQQDSCLREGGEVMAVVGDHVSDGGVVAENHMSEGREVVVVGNHLSAGRPSAVGNQLDDGSEAILTNRPSEGRYVMENSHSNSSGEVAIGGRLEELQPAAVDAPASRNYGDLSRSNNVHAHCNVFVEQTYPYPSAGFEVNPVLWSKPEHSGNT